MKYPRLCKDCNRFLPISKFILNEKYGKLCPSCDDCHSNRKFIIKPKLCPHNRLCSRCDKCFNETTVKIALKKIWRKYKLENYHNISILTI
jgi:hypothetical protein